MAFLVVWLGGLSHLTQVLVFYKKSAIFGLSI